MLYFYVLKENLSKPFIENINKILIIRSVVEYFGKKCLNEIFFKNDEVPEFLREYLNQR